MEKTVMVHHAWPPALRPSWSGVEWSMGFLDCLRREGGREGEGGVRSVSLWLEDPEEV